MQLQLIILPPVYCGTSFSKTTNRNNITFKTHLIETCRRSLQLRKLSVSTMQSDVKHTSTRVVVIACQRRQKLFVQKRVSRELEMCGNGFQHSHSLPFPSIQFTFLPIPIPNF